MQRVSKGKSPFYPGQPVPVELFVGRTEQINRIMERGVGQVENGKPVAIYIQGEYGIGKSSIASLVQFLAERKHGLHSLYASLGAVDNVDDLGAEILKATLNSGAFEPKRGECVRNWLAKYIGEQSLFGVTIHTEALRKDAPTIASGTLPFLTEILNRLQPTGVKGIMLVLDEINGITGNPAFAHYIKSLIDTNAMARKPLPLLLMLCGVEERRREMIRHHQPVERLFDVIDIDPLSDEEMKDFFHKAFESVKIKVAPEAASHMAHYSAGFPKIMHLVGDAAFWLDQDGFIDKDEAMEAVFMAAEEVGKKYVDQQVYRALRSKDYHSILAKIAKTGLDMSFNRSEIAKDLTEPERKKLGNFLTKMKNLKVIRAGLDRGEYVFNVRMVRLYIWLQSLRKSNE